MSLITAQSIITKAGLLLNDDSSVRWTTSEMLGWLTDGQREIAVDKPYLCSKIAVATLVAGVRQSLSALTDYNLLLNVKRNIESDGVTAGRTVSIAAAETLDALNPDWHLGILYGTVVHYTFDPSTRAVFQVYPPAIAGTKVELTYSYVPAAFTALADVIVVPDSLGTSLIDYLCYRALTKDAEFGDVGSKAAAHYKLFTDAVSKF